MTYNKIGTNGLISSLSLAVFVLHQTEIYLLSIILFFYFLQLRDGLRSSITRISLTKPEARVRDVEFHKEDFLLSPVVQIRHSASSRSVVRNLLWPKYIDPLHISAKEEQIIITEAYE